MSVPNTEFFHFSSWGSSYDPTYFNHYDPAWLKGESKQTKEGSKGDKDKEQVTELDVNLCCEGCVEKVYKKVKAMDGVATVHCDADKNKVTVTGPAKPDAILKEVKRISHKSGSKLSKKK